MNDVVQTNDAESVANETDARDFSPQADLESNLETLLMENYVFYECKFTKDIKPTISDVVHLASNGLKNILSL